MTLRRERSAKWKEVEQDHVLLMEGLRFVFNRERTAAVRRAGRLVKLEHISA
jgi:hypothetical protein